MDINYYKQYEPIFGVWHITRLIGEGSFGKVFEIEREDFGQVYKAALKAITIPASQSEVRSVRSEGMDEESVRATFHSKVQELVKKFALMSKLKGNSNVVSYENHQVIEHKDNIGWDILIQMELLTPLDEYIQKKKSLPRQEIIKLGIDLCKALELCQKHNIIHRDIKPENTFISENGDFKPGDFGVARTIEKTTGACPSRGATPTWLRRSTTVSPTVPQWIFTPWVSSFTGCSTATGFLSCPQLPLQLNTPTGRTLGTSAFMEPPCPCPATPTGGWERSC